jgi:hypothetical protein
MATTTKRPSTIELTAEENELLGRITFGSSCSHEMLRASCEAAALLSRSLLAREAIPKIRLRYFTDPELNIGSKKSREQSFEANGTKGEDILSHGNFLPYLRYFIFGPDLPIKVIDDFWIQVISTGFVSGSDIDALRKIARIATRHHHLDARVASEEFFKIALECGVGVSYARSIRDAVRAVRCQAT